MQVKVWNDNVLPFTQDFEDYTVTIAANRFITMDIEKAQLFLGKYYPIERDQGGVQTVRSYKKLRIEEVDQALLAKEVEPLRCMACTFIGIDKNDLDNHITHAHLGQMLDKDEVKKRTKS